MKNYPIILILIFSFSSELSFATFYQKGDTLNVWAVSGLNMREGPGTDFPKIKKLEYGEKVEVIDKYLGSTPLNLTVVKKTKNSDAFVLEGFWVRVKAGTQEGYVFDGYLSRLKTIDIKKGFDRDSISRWESEGLVNFLKKNYQLEKTGKKMIDNYDGQSTYHTFSSGIVHERWASKCAGEKVTLFNISKNEAYLIFNSHWQFEYKIKKKQKNNGNQLFPWKIKLNSKEKLEIHLDSGECNYRLIFSAEKISLDVLCCC